MRARSSATDVKGNEEKEIISHDFPNDSQEERSENRTVSTVEFEPGVEDHGKSITCRAENPNVTGLFVEKSWKIDVVCEYTLHFSLTFQFLADRKLAHGRQIAKLIAVNRIRRRDE